MLDIQRFKRQVGLLRDLRHPNVLQFYGTTNIDGSLYSVCFMSLFRASD